MVCWSTMSRPAPTFTVTAMGARRSNAWPTRPEGAAGDSGSLEPRNAAAEPAQAALPVDEPTGQPSGPAIARRGADQPLTTAVTDLLPIAGERGQRVAQPGPAVAIQAQVEEWPRLTA